MKILLLGKNGQVGRELQRALAPLGELTALDRTQPGGDLARLDSMRETVRAIRPDVIVNAAAYTDVDQAESERDIARMVNADAPGVLAQEARRMGVWLVHYSTDYVFDGSGSTARDETAATGPLSVYGRTKLEGEELIRASGCAHLIFRTGWVYAARGNNFARAVLQQAAELDRLMVVEDQIGAPTSAQLLADITAHALRAAAGRPEVAGTYHAVAAGETSWYGYARFVVAWACAHGHTMRVMPEAIEPVPTRAYSTAAQRPLNSRLATQKLCQTFALRLPHWQLGVERLLRQELLQGRSRQCT